MRITALRKKAIARPLDSRLGYAARVRPRSSILVPIVLVACLGCASMGSRPNTITPLPKDVDLSRFQSVRLSVTPADGSYIPRSAASRIRALIVRDVGRHHLGRIAPTNTSSAAPALEMHVQITRYEEGDALARLMLAGLGQIHIEGDVRIYGADAADVLAWYEVAKTFAWGGTYGAATSIRDVEVGFAKTVAGIIASLPMADHPATSNRGSIRRSTRSPPRAKQPESSARSSLCVARWPADPRRQTRCTRVQMQAYQSVQPAISRLRGDPGWRGGASLRRCYSSAQTSHGTDWEWVSHCHQSEAAAPVK